MKGYFPIEIPTKKYIKAYIHAQLGENPIINTGHKIENKLYDVLSRNTNEYGSRFATRYYNARVKLFVNYSTFFHRGGCLNETNIKNFNLFVEEEIKSTYRMLMDFYIDLLPSFEANLPAVRKRIGIDIDAWDTDSIKKDYWRYRKRTGKPLLYKSNADRIIISRSDIQHGFIDCD